MSQNHTRPPKHLPQFKETNWFWIRIHVMQLITAISTCNYLIKHHIKHIMQKAFYTSSILNICTFHNLSFALLRTTSDDKFYFSYVFIRFSIIHHYLCQCQI
jgi:hypothetical protein